MLLLCVACIGATPETTLAASVNPWKPVSQPPAQAQPSVAVTKKGKAPTTSGKITRAPQKPAETQDERLHRQLMEFMHKTIASMNRQRKPGINTKEVKRTSNGKYVAHYIAVDANSLEAKYKVTQNKTVPYVGQVVYYEIKYTCTGDTERQALAGPFSENDRVPVTELIKYMRGRWTY